MLDATCLNVYEGVCLERFCEGGGLLSGSCGLVCVLQSQSGMPLPTVWIAVYTLWKNYSLEV